MGGAPAAQVFTAQNNGAQAFNAQNVDPVLARTGGALAQGYYNPFLQDVVNASIADYNANAERTLSAMRQGRDAAGAFGDRAAIADAVYQADATRGLGATVSGLRSQAFDTAQGFGQAEANRLLSADMANAGNLLNNRQFNVNALNQNAKFNADALNETARFNAGALNQSTQFDANLLDGRDRFNVDAGYRGDQQRLQANDAVAAYRTAPPSWISRGSKTQRRRMPATWLVRRRFLMPAVSGESNSWVLCRLHSRRMVRVHKGPRKTGRLPVPSPRGQGLRGTFPPW